MHGYIQRRALKSSLLFPIKLAFPLINQVPRNIFYNSGIHFTSAPLVPHWGVNGSIPTYTKKLFWTQLQRIEKCALLAMIGCDQQNSDVSKVTSTYFDSGRVVSSRSRTVANHGRR